MLDDKHGRANVSMLRGGPSLGNYRCHGLHLNELQAFI